MNKELKEILEAFRWTFDNMGTPHTSDHFNIPANGIKMLEDFIDKAGVSRSFTPEEIKQQAKDFCDKWLPKWKKYCDVCKGCNCKNNDTCIHCGCQF